MGGGRFLSPPLPPPTLVWVGVASPGTLCQGSYRRKVSLIREERKLAMGQTVTSKTTCWLAHLTVAPPPCPSQASVQPSLGEQVGQCPRGCPGRLPRGDKDGRIQADTRDSHLLLPPIRLESTLGLNPSPPLPTVK